MMMESEQFVSDAEQLPGLRDTQEVYEIHQHMNLERLICCRRMKLCIYAPKIHQNAKVQLIGTLLAD